MFNNTRTIISAGIVLLVVVITQNLHAKEVWQWTDSEGITHITDNKSKIPEEYTETAKKHSWNDESNNQNVIVDDFYDPNANLDQEPYVDGIVDTEHEMVLREKWRAKAVAIEQEEAEIRSKLAKAKADQEYKKREVDWYLRNGYQADYMIHELKGLERYIEDLEEELTTIPPKIDALRIEARKAGVPEGYLRE